MLRVYAVAVGLVLACGIALAANNTEGTAEPRYHRFKRQSYLNNGSGGKCSVSGNLENGKFFINPSRCPSKICTYAPGALVPSGWDIYYECDPGFEPSTMATRSVCENGRWSPELPTCFACGNSTEVGSLSPLISNGKNAPIGTFPWHAGLYTPVDKDGELTWVQNCAGSLINAQFVVTAAHCVVVDGELVKKEDVRIALGKYFRSWDQFEENKQTRNVKRIEFQQDKYNKLSFYFDIALLMMDKKVEFTQFVMPVCSGIPYESNYVHNNKLYVAGWGLTETGKPSDFLKYTDVSILPTEDCKKRITSSYHLLEKFCTLKSGNSGVVVREGDSGGGLTVIYKGRHYIVGIVSLNLNTVTLFTDVNFSINKIWMEKEINSCQPSATLVNGEEACSGEVVFEDDFSGPLDDDKTWDQNYVIGGKTGPWALNVFDGDETHGFTKDGSLIIKPTVYNETFLTNGTLKLKRCNGGGCTHKATPENILPPVASANMDTFKSFSFRYGILEIRAKLPIGDWLSPVLELVSKGAYGSKRESGLMQIISRGNSDMRCYGDIGLGQVDLWALFGPDNNLQWKARTIRNLPQNFFKDYHTYKITWMPESITFHVDSELVGEIRPEKTTLCKDIFSEEHICAKYINGTAMAPFDKEFFIRIGVMAGNAFHFHDVCINRGKPKSWKNYNSKARLEFWNDRENWQPTWTEEGAALHIDYIRVTAL